jgi:hypothetical protein
VGSIRDCNPKILCSANIQVSPNERPELNEHQKVLHHKAYPQVFS